LRPGSRIFAAIAVLLPSAVFCAQTTSAAIDPPPTLAASTLPPAPVPATTHTFHDPNDHLSFDYPATWTFAHTDHEISTFHLDARSAPRAASLRAVAAMPENPFPASTFSGAYVYFSVTPHSSAASCAKQAAPPANSTHKLPAKPTATHINDIPFTHGHDEQKDICIIQRDEIYTAYRRGACYRFDLTINNFCGGEVSGVKDITPSELDQVRTRLEAILSTVRFDTK
jgi:hypothetical protein